MKYQSKHQNTQELGFLLQETQMIASKFLVMNGDVEPLTYLEPSNHCSGDKKPQFLTETSFYGSGFGPKLWTHTVTLISIPPRTHLRCITLNVNTTSPSTDLPSGQGEELGCHLWAPCSLIFSTSQVMQNLYLGVCSPLYCCNVKLSNGMCTAH